METVYRKNELHAKSASASYEWEDIYFSLSTAGQI